MPVTIRALAPAALALLLACVPALGAEPRTIAIEVDGDARFDVVYHRALTNATGAVIAGLIGAGIQAGIEADHDAKKRRELAAHVAEDAWRDVFLRTLTETLVAKGFEPVWVETDGHQRAGADLYLVLYPATYGFRMVDSTTALVSAYVEFEARYASEPLAARNKSPPRERFYVTDRTQVSYDDLVAETAGIHPRVAAALALGARRLANKIVYNTKTP